MTNARALIVIDEDSEGVVAVHFSGDEESRPMLVAQRMYQLLKRDLDGNGIGYDDSGERIEDARGNVG